MKKCFYKLLIKINDFLLTKMPFSKLQFGYNAKYYYKISKYGGCVIYGYYDFFSNEPIHFIIKHIISDDLEYDKICAQEIVDLLNNT